MALPTTASSARPFTYEDLEAMPDDGYRREIIGGSLIVHPSPRLRHQVVVGNLFNLLRAAEVEGVRTVVARYAWLAPGGDVLQPDVVVIRAADADLDGPLRRGAVPLLVVEVLSPSNRDHDLVTKRARYEAAGVPSLWLADPDRPSIQALTLGDEGSYAVAAEVTGTATFTAQAPVTVAFPVADLLR